MGMDISNGNGEDRRFSGGSWIGLLNLAHEYGWQPAGTEIGGLYSEEPPEDANHTRLVPVEQAGTESWDGNYTSNDGQLISAEDADAIADALERAFGDKPDYQDFWDEGMVDYFRAGALRIF